MSKTWFTMRFTYAELYGLRNALRESGKEPELLDRIEEQIRYLHDYFDGKYVPVCREIGPSIEEWRGVDDDCR